ncbi:hypothetical protein ACJJTC_016191 [Scirpophaga incertulas]
METTNNIGIAPNPDSVKEVIGCQCELGREKLLTAPPYKRSSSPPGDEALSRYSTAPCARDLEQFKCPISHILVTFKSPMHQNEMFSKVFPASTPMKFVKRKLAKLLSISNSNLLLTKNRTVLKDTSVLSDLKTDALGSLIIDVFTKNSDDFSLSSIPKESYMHDLLHAMLPKKNLIPFIAIKFRVSNQNAVFTRSYHSIMKVHEVKNNLGSLFQVEAENVVLMRSECPLKDRMALYDLDYDKYGIVDVELLMKNNEKLNLDKLYKEIPVNDVLSVMIPYGATVRQINVEIFSELIKKPYLGGYRNIHTGIEYHHAYTQTPQKPEKLPPEKKNCRDTQTAEEKEKIFDTNYSRATQMNTVQAYIPNVNDKIIIPKPYETYDQMIIRLNHNHFASIIQRCFRHYQFRQNVARWLRECRDLITKTYPKTREDFDQLYAMVDRWKHAEISRITQLHSKGPKIAEFSLLLDKEVELLRCIEAYRVKVKEDNKKIKEQKFLEEISKPVAWYGKNGKLITMETIEIQKARKLKELYNSFIQDDMDIKERMELLVDMKFALQEFTHPLAEEITTLLDRECDLLVRRCNDHQIDFLRRRVAASVFQLIKTSELNSGVTKCKDIRDFRSMENNRLHFCENCHQVKRFSEFPLNSKMCGFVMCTSCSWKDVSERIWVDMTPYKFILRAVQRDERRRKCWGSIAFVLQEKDIFFIVEKLWHSHSAISECNDLTELRLCRWNVKEDWSPWNCLLVTVQEMKAHLKLEAPDEVYDDEFVQKVKNKHKLARANFEQLTSVNKHFTESGDWQNIRAPAVTRCDGVPPI